jgi:hypothetical protein
MTIQPHLLTPLTICGSRTPARNRAVNDIRSIDLPRQELRPSSHLLLTVEPSHLVYSSPFLWRPDEDEGDAEANEMLNTGMSPRFPRSLGFTQIGKKHRVKRP